MHQQSQLDYYRKNSKYSAHLEHGNPQLFALYIDTINKYLTSKERFLDVGCGTGIVVDAIAKSKKQAIGIEISETSLAIAKNTRLGKYFLYNGDKLPFNNDYFGVVGSFTVIEHVESVSMFLNESFRVLKPNGYLIICAPNFLALTNSYHYHTRGVFRKITNVLTTLAKIVDVVLFNKVAFNKMQPVTRPNFQPDDDAVNVINPTDLLGYARLKKYKIMEYRGSIIASKLTNFLGSIPIVNLFTGGTLIVIQKKHDK